MKPFLIKKVLVNNKVIKIQFTWQSKQFGSRFGALWNWKLGIDAGHRTMLINLLICYFRIDWMLGLKAAEPLKKPNIIKLKR
jgi:hypothetical protein